MIKLINGLGWAILFVGLLVGETAHPVTLIALAAASAGCFWLSHALYKEVLQHRYQVQGAPIASQLSRDLRIEV